MLNTLAPLSVRPVHFAREIDRLLDLPARVGSVLEPTGGAWPGLNAWQDGDHIVIEAEIPGFSIDDIRVELGNDMITLSGERESGAPEGATTIRMERRVTRFERSLRLPVAVDAAGAEASLNQGVLRVTLPIAAWAKTRRIEIKSAERAALPAREAAAPSDGSAV